MFCKDIINYLIFSDTVCCYNIFSCELSLRKFTVFWTVSSGIDLVRYCLLHIAQFIHVIYIYHRNIRMVCCQFIRHRFFSLKSSLWFRILNEQNCFPAVSHLFCQSLCCFCSCSFIVRRYIRSHSLIIRPGIKSDNRDLAVCCEIKLYLASLQIYNWDSDRNRISVQFFIQKVHLIIHIICFIRCIIRYFYLVFSCISKTCIQILCSLCHAFLHFVPILRTIRLSYNRNVVSLFQLQSVCIIISRRTDQV